MGQIIALPVQYLDPAFDQFQPQWESILSSSNYTSKLIRWKIARSTHSWDPNFREPAILPQLWMSIVCLWPLFNPLPLPVVPGLVILSTGCAGYLLV